jgi:predicted acylesterase/phospholipase RssA/CRP-like cAMP-binding protein
MTSPDLLAYIKSTDLFAALDEATLQDLATELECVVLRAGETLFRQDDPSDAMYIVMSGRLQAVITQPGDVRMVMGDIEPGQPVGEMQILAGGNRTASVHALRDTELIKLSKAAFEDLAEKAPKTLLRTAEIIRQRLRRHQLAFALADLFGPLNEGVRQDIEAQAEWVHLRRGQALFRSGDPGDSLYILVNGRLQAIVEDPDGSERLVAELVRGEIVGEMAVFSEEVRSASIYAIQDSVLVKFSKPTVERIVARYPQVMSYVTRIVISRLRQHIRLPSETSSVTSIAIIPAGPDVRLGDFANRLALALSAIGPTLHLNSQRLDILLEAPGMAQTPADNPNDVRLSVWLDEKEAQSRFVLYEADMAASPWTRRCIQRADQILIIARATASPALGEIETAWLGPNTHVTTAQQSLVLLHPDGSRVPFGTRQWLNERQVSKHHHLRWNADADFERLARFLTGGAIGLILGGGGARCFAQIGVIRALEQAGVPIDMVGGNSMGAVIAAQYAMGWDYETMLQVNRKNWPRIKSLRSTTLPIISLLSSRQFDHIVRDACGDTYIENLWVSYFCVSANLATAETVVHQRGPVWKAARASCSVPGIATPVLDGNNLLIDGGVLDNLPSGIMKTLCGGKVIAVNVSPSRDKDFTIDDTFKSIPSPSRILWSRLNPFKKSINFPNIIDVMIRTTMLSSAHKANWVQAEADLYLRPPVDHFGLIEYEAIDEIVQAGYEHAQEKIQEWKG